MKATEASLARALLLPLFVTAALAALVLRPAKAVSLPVRPPLATPVAFDELVTNTSGTAQIEPGQAPPSAEGLRSLKAR